MADRISRGEILIRTAELWALRSTCFKPNGAVLARDGRIIAIGYNGSPAGHPHCLDVGCEEGPDGGCQRTLHAEANAIAMAARFGVSTEGSIMYCTSSPCPMCAKLLINAGIKEFYFRTLYRITDGIGLMLRSHIQVYQFRGQITVPIMGKELEGGGFEVEL